jgi:hypothetical protein
MVKKDVMFISLIYLHIHSVSVIIVHDDENRNKMEKELTTY